MLHLNIVPYCVMAACGVLSIIFFLKMRVKKASPGALYAKAITSVAFILSWLVLARQNMNGFAMFIGGGLLFGLLGDIFLDLKFCYPVDDDVFTKQGFLSFAVGHVFYILAVIYGVSGSFSIKALLCALGVAVIAALVVFFGEKAMQLHYGDYKIISTLYGALMYAGMTTVERHHHSLVVDYCEASMDAAVSEDAMDDFVFMNDTAYAIYIYTSVINKESATVYIYSNRPEYRIDLVSTIIQNNIKNPNIEVRVDTSGKIAQYTSQRILYKEGKLGRRSMLERVYYDWDTGREVKREVLSEDYYSGERDVYMTGMLAP